MGARFSYPIAVAVTVLLMLVPVAVVATYGDAPWINRLGFVLQLLAVYGIGIGFVQKSDALKGFPALDEMTSSHPLKFVRGNAVFLGMLSSLAGVAFGARSRASSRALGLLGQGFVLCAFPVLLVYFILHIVILMPFAYLGYLFSSAVVESVAGSTDDAEWSASEGDQVVARLGLRAAIANNRAAMKSFLIGIPATMLGLILKSFEIFG